MAEEFRPDSGTSDAPDSQSTESRALTREIADHIETSVNDVIGELVHKAVALEEERRFRQLKWIALFIGLIGLGTFGTLATVAIEKIVDSRVGGIKETLELTRINNLANKLDLAKGFSPEERDEIMSLLLKISKSPERRTQPEVRSAVASILDSFASAGLNAQVEAIHANFDDIIAMSAISTEILIHYYGQNLAARISIPTTEDLTLKRFESLERLAAGHNLAELPLAYRLLYEFKQRAPDSRLRQLLAASLDLEPSDRARFLQEILIRTKATNWQRLSDASGLELQRTTRQFFKTHANLVSDVFGTPLDIVEVIGDDGVDEEQAGALAILMAETDSDDVVDG